jgi:hypothetical protein
VTAAAVLDGGSEPVVVDVSVEGSVGRDELAIARFARG